MPVLSPHQSPGFDDAAFIQNVINNSSYGAVIELAEGEWNLYSQLHLPAGRTLKGAGRHFDNNTFRLSGTVLNVRWGNGTGSSEDMTKAALIVGPSTTVQDLMFNYPSQVQTRSTPIEYGPTIKLWADLDGNIDAYHCDVKLDNLHLYKSYVGIDARGSDSRNNGTGLITTNRFDNILMAAMKYGLRLDNCFDWSYMTRIEQQPGHIGHHATPGSSLRDWVQNNGTFVQLGKTVDWGSFTNCGSWATAVGLEIDGVSGPVAMKQFDVDAALVPVYLKGHSPNLNLRFESSTFTAFSATSLYSGGPAQSSSVVVADSNAVADGITFSNCYLFGPSRNWGWFGNPCVNVRNIMLTGCVTKVSPEGGPAPIVDLSTGADRLVMTGNICEGTQGLYGGDNKIVLEFNNLIP